MRYYKLREQKEPSGKIITYHLGELDNECISEYYGENGEVVLSLETTEEKANAWAQMQELELTPLSEAEFKEFVQGTEQGKAIWELTKEQREKELNSQIATLRGVRFNVDEVAMDRFNRLICLANAKYNQAILSGVSAQEASAIYQTRIQWKSADNEFVEISIQDMCELLENGMREMQTLWERVG